MVVSAQYVQNLLAEIMFDVDDVHSALRYRGAPGGGLRQVVKQAKKVEGRFGVVKSMAEDVFERLCSEESEEREFGEERVFYLLRCVARVRTAVYRLMAAVCHTMETEVADSAREKAELNDCRIVKAWRNMDKTDWNDWDGFGSRGAEQENDKLYGKLSGKLGALLESELVGEGEVGG